MGGEPVFVQEEAAASSSWSPLVFGANCTACHANGKNNVKAEKTLFPEPLKANGRYEIPDMINWITAGGLGMPAFGERLGPDDIEDVANYVRGQADKGW